jgi:hypothetical protein
MVLHFVEMSRRFMARMILNLKDAHHRRIIEQRGGTEGSTAISTDVTLRFSKRSKSIRMSERDFELDTTVPLSKLTVDVRDDLWDGRVLPTKPMELKGMHSSSGSYEPTDSAGRSRQGDNPIPHDGEYATRLNTDSFA